MNRDDLINAMMSAAPKPIEVDVPEWGGKAYVRGQSVADIDASRTKMEDPDGKYATALLLAHMLCDENGVRTFSLTDEAGIKLLADQPASVIQRLVEASKIANGVETAKND